MSVTVQETLIKPHGRVLSTLEEDGSRRWMYPRLSKGRFWERRRLTAYALIAIFALVPHIHIASRPILLLDLIHRHFIILGKTFLPTDTIFLALFMVGFILSIFGFTAIFGRVWCGWACPQTVYMEYLVRPIERLFTGRSGVGGKPVKAIPGWRRGAMYATFFVICLHLANTFLAYFVPPAILHHWITSSPLNHPAGFAIVAVVTGLMLFDFCYFREQTCIIACPYGRFQSVLMDRQSLIISYDAKRGEPRGKVKPQSTNGDCIDCDICVSVCPTGIDIREGLQIECVACAQCIDACDAVMDKINRARGLIRYGSQSALAGEESRIVRPRVIIYGLLVTAIISLLSVLLLSKSPADVTLLRNLGRPFVITASGDVENTMRLKLTNRSTELLHLTFSISGRGDVRIIPSKPLITLAPLESWTEPVQILAPQSAFTLGTLDITLRVSGDNNLALDRPCRLLGPMNGGTNAR